MCFGEKQTDLLLRVTNSNGCYISAAAVTQAVCLQLKSVQHNEHIILNVGNMSQMYFLCNWKGKVYCTERRTFSICRIQLVCLSVPRYIYIVSGTQKEGRWSATLPQKK
jgi:hypothetical protein